MTRHTPLWLQSGSYAAAVDRQLPGALWPSARCDGCAVTFAAAMSVNVDAGKVAVPVAGGTLLCPSDAVEQVTLPAAPAAGTDRIDLIVCHARGTDIDGGVNNDFVFESVQGVAAAPPAAPPSVPVNTARLAQIRLPGGSAAIDPANIYDLRPPSLAVGGATAPPPLAAGAAFASYVDTSGEVWVAKGGVYGGAWKRARDVIGCRYHRNAAYTAPAPPGGVFGMDTMDYDPYRLYGGNVTGLFTCPIAGVYLVSYQYASQTTANGQYVQATVRKNGAAVAAYNGYGSQNVYATYAAVTDQIACAAGDTLAGWMQGSIAMSGLTGVGAYIAISYLGTG
jgi:hypothetical protein